MEAENTGVNLTEEANNDLYDRTVKAQGEIERATDLGRLLLSDRTIQRLDRYLIEEGNSILMGDRRLTLEGGLGATDSCLKDLIKLARQDLKIDRNSKYPIKQVTPEFTGAYRQSGPIPE